MGARLGPTCGPTKATGGPVGEYYGGTYQPYLEAIIGSGQRVGPELGRQEKTDYCSKLQSGELVDLGDGWYN